MVRHATAHKYVQQKKKKEPFDYLVYFFMVATPLFEVPQAIQIFSNKSAENVSVATWMFFFVASFVWAIYAYKNRLFPLVVTYSLYIIIEGTIVTGIIFYS
jgi:uncharacterized protein with PQ loop repeat